MFTKLPVITLSWCIDIISLRCSPGTYTVLCVNYISERLEEKNGGRKPSPGEWWNVWFMLNKTEVAGTVRARPSHFVLKSLGSRCPCLLSGFGCHPSASCLLPMSRVAALGIRGKGWHQWFSSKPSLSESKLLPQERSPYISVAKASHSPS